MAKTPKNLYLTEEEIKMLERLSERLGIAQSRVVGRLLKLYSLEIIDEK